MMFDLIKEFLQKENCTCVAEQNGQIVYTGTGPGVKPLLTAYKNHPELLRDSVTGDKIIGKAAAMLLVLAGARAVYGSIMSQPGKAYLEAHGIITACGKLVPYIENRTGTGMCPLEQSVLHIENASQGLQAMEIKIAELMSGKST